MTLTIEQLKAAVKTDNVPRFPTHWILRPDLVSQHQYRATLYYIFLGGTELVAMLTHDAPESYTSDIPSPVKKDIIGLDKFDYLSVAFKDPIQKKLGKVCDKLDLLLVLRNQLDAIGKLPDSLMNIYEDEMDKMLDLAKEIGKLKEVKQLLKEIGK